MYLNRDTRRMPQILKLFRRSMLMGGCGLAALGAAGCMSSSEKNPVPDEQAVLQQDKRATEYMRLGDDLRAKGDLESAAEMYNRARSADSKSPAPPAALGDTLRRLGRYAEAEQVFRDGLDRSPYSGMLLQGYAVLMLEKGQPEAAVTTLTPVVDEEAADFRIYNVLGIAYDMLGDHMEAQAQYTAGLAQTPSNRSLRNNLALSLAIQERYDAAIEQIQMVAGDDTVSQHNLALIYGLSGRIEEAARVSRKLLPESDVANNLAYYQSLRALEPAQRRSAILEMLLRSLFTAVTGSAADKSPS